MVLTRASLFNALARETVASRWETALGFVPSLGKGKGFLEAGGLRSRPGAKVSHLLGRVVCTAAGGRARSKNSTFFLAPNIRDRHPSALSALSFLSASLGSFAKASEHRL